VLISLVGIAAGLIAMVGLLISNPLRGWTALFLITTILTSATGFLFPFTSLLPSHIVGILSLLLLAVAVVALYVRHLAGVWRPVYVVTAMVSLYLNVFVLIIQAFQKVGPLHALAPTQTELPFVAVQGATLLVFIAVTLLAARRFRPAMLSMA
jgi:magnesium-transporting ATPase (P-type)